MSVISTLNDGNVDKQAPEGKKPVTLKREGKGILIPVQKRQYEVDRSTRVSVQHRALQRNIKDGTQTCCVQETGTTHIPDRMVRKPPSQDLLTTHKSRKGN